MQNILGLIIELSLDFIGRLISKSLSVFSNKPLKTLEKDRLIARYISRRIKLRSGINEKFPKGTLGEVIEVIDEETLLLKFEDLNGNLISVNGTSHFPVNKRKVMLVRRTQAIN